MEKAKTGKFNFSTVVLIFAVAISIFQLYTGFFGVLEARLQRGVHLYSLLALLFLTDTLKKDRGKLLIADWFGAVSSLGILVYTILENERISSRLRFVDPVTTLDIVCGILTILLLLEATRRIIGYPLMILAAVFLAYTMFGHFIPGPFGHVQVQMLSIIDGLFLERIGIFGLTLGVSATYAFHFILFGAFFVKSGVGKFFVDISLAIAGRARGGPAKVAVVSSALVAVSNVYTTGAFSIPLMKRLGYSPVFAGAVEAVASTGGMSMPPVMGAAAFVMAELIGASYTEVALAAAIPAVLYFLSVLLMIHFRSLKQGMKGLAEEEVPDARQVLREGWMKVVPLIVLVAVMFLGYSATMAVNASIVSILLISAFKKETRFSPMDIVNALSDGARSAILIAVATGTAGIIVGSLSLTGSGLKFVNAITSLSGGISFMIPVMIMVACIILGMGLPVTPAYIIVASLMGPVFVNLGIPLKAAHLFMLYFATISAITPPVAISAFAAGTLAGAPLMATGVQASKLGIAAFIVPYMFIYGPALVGIGTPLEVITASVAAVIGVIALASAVEGWFFVKSRWYERVLMFAASILLINTGLVTDAIGISLMLAVILLQRVRKKSLQKSAGEAAT